ncbi:MAG: BrnT family toxin [Elusimicrobia bacterium]|nr:BrnT family toxin [Elusimicrobiota bacterium]
MSVIDPSGCSGFDWDKGNAEKNWKKHHVSPSESEQIFFNRPLLVAPDESHSDKEPRFYALGRTDLERPLFVVFTIRGNLIRVICARDMNRREREAFKSHEKNP